MPTKSEETGTWSSVNGGTRGMPWQVRALVAAPVTAIACYLVWQLASTHAAETREIGALLRTRIEIANKVEAAHEQRDRDLLRISRQICVNGTTTEAGRRGCE